MLIEIDLDFFQTVFLRTDTEQLPRMITKITVHPGMRIIYELSCGMEASSHYREEITEEKLTF